MILWLLPSVFNASNSAALDTFRVNAINNKAFLKFDIEDESVAAWTCVNNKAEWEEIYRCWISDATKFKQTNIAKVCSSLSSSNFSEEIPILSLSDAINVISMPCLLTMENANNDVNFLKCVVDKNTRDEISRKIDNNQIIALGGGIGEVKKKLRNSDNPLVLRFKMFVVVDSDCKRLNELHPEVIAVENLCQEKFVSYHVLQRRMIENYFPLELLYQSIPFPARVNTQIYKMVQAFKALNQEQRYCLHLKVGLRDTSAHSTIYANLSASDSQLLNSGFTNLAEKYDETQMQEKIHYLMHQDIEGDEVQNLAIKVKNYLRTPV